MQGQFDNGLPLTAQVHFLKWGIWLALWVELPGIFLIYNLHIVISTMSVLPAFALHTDSFFLIHQNLLEACYDWWKCLNFKQKLEYFSSLMFTPQSTDSILWGQMSKYRLRCWRNWQRFSISFGFEQYTYRTIRDVPIQYRYKTLVWYQQK